MEENLEKKNSQNISSIPDDILDWDDYDEEYEEDDKNEFQNEPSNTESKNVNHKDSEEIEEDTYSDTYNRSKTNKDYSYSNNTYRGKNYSSYYGRGGFGNKKFNKQSRIFNKGYDNSYYHRNSNYYNRKKQNSDIYNNKDYYKYNKEHNYESKKDYKTVEKEYEYDNPADYDKKKYYGKKYNYGSRYKNDYNSNKNISYSTREFIDDDKKNNKNPKFKSEYKQFPKDEENKEKTDENISKPLFYNSKIANTQEAPANVQKFIKTEDFIQIENLVFNINKIVRDTYISLRSKMNKNIEEQYGSLNINAKTYVPKRKILKENNNNPNNNINFGPGIVNNNNNIPQNYIPPYY